MGLPTIVGPRPFDLAEKNDEKELAAGIRGPAQYPLTDTAAPEKYATYSRSLLDEQRAAMQPLFLTWTQNLLFIAGHQWWRYDPLTGSFKLPALPAWRERPVRNLLVPFVKHFVAKVTKNRPVTTCVPASTDPNDIQAATLGNDVLKSKWEELQMSRTLRRAVTWVIATGNGYLAPYWNTDSGVLQPLTTLVQAHRHLSPDGSTPDVDPATGAPAVETLECPCDENGDPKLDEQGNYDLESEPAYIDIGDLGVKVYSPFQVFVDAGAVCEEDVTYTIIVEPLTIREVHRRWPQAQGDIVAEDTAQVERFDQLIAGAIAGADTHLTASQIARDNMIPKTLVVHYFERKTAQFCHGRHWVSCGQTMLEDPGPLPDGIWPVVVHLKDIEVAGRYHAEATMTAAVGLQREYNEVNAQIKEHHNLLLRGKWLVPLGSNIRRGQITSQPGEVIQHTPGLPPQMARLEPLPEAVYQEREQIVNDFQLITGLNKISMGQAPPGVTAGRAFLTLQEADDSDLGPFLTMLEESIAELGWLEIQLIQRFYDDDRLLRVSGQNNRYRVRAFKGADLDAIVDVEPQAGSAFPWSQTAKQSAMVELATALPMVFTDPETGQFDTDRFREMLPIGGDQAIGMGSDLDVAEALREEEIIEMWDGASVGPDGTPALPVPQPWQNQQTHLRQHARLLKSAEIQKWPPANQQALIQHWQAHKAMAVQLASEQAIEQGQAQMLAQGGQAPAAAGGSAPAQSPQTPQEQTQQDVENQRAMISGMDQADAAN